MEKKDETCAKEQSVKEAREQDGVVAFRKACKATGTGLSHYILMDDKGEG